MSGCDWNDPGYVQNQFCDEFSLVGATEAPNVQYSFGTSKVTQQLQWTLMGLRGAVLHITGPLPLQKRSFQQSATGAVWEGEILLFWLGGVLSTQPQVHRPVKMIFLYLVHTCHVCNLLPKSSIQIAWRAAFVCHFTALKESRGQKFVNRAESKKGHHHHIKRETSLQTCGNALMIGRIRPGPFFTHWAHPRARG